jgi:CHAT domain-containing protein/tetratricopeptide (TPR) repeat protein
MVWRRGLVSVGAAVMCGVAVVVVVIYFMAGGAALVAGGTAPQPGAEGLDALEANVVTPFQSGKYAEATEAATRALRAVKARDGEMSAGYARALSRAANTWLVRRGFTEALPLLKEAQAVATGIQPKDDDALAQALADMGTFHWSQGRHADAEPLFRQALDIRETTLSDSDPRYVDLARLLALVLSFEGRHEDSERLLRQAIGRAEARLGLDHPYVAALLAELNFHYALRPRIGDSSKLDAELEAVKSRSESILAKAIAAGRISTTSTLATPTMLPALIGLGTRYSEKRRLAEAEQVFKLALAIPLRKVNAELAFMAATQRGIAIYGLLDLYDLYELYDPQRRFAEFIAVATRALDEEEQHLANDAYPDLVRGRIANLNRRLAKVYIAQKNDALAEGALKRALAAAEGETDEMQIADVLAGGYLIGDERVPQDMASFYEKRGRFADADAALTRALAIREKLQNGASDEIKELRQRLAQVRKQPQTGGQARLQAALQPAAPRPVPAAPSSGRSSDGCSDVLAMIDNWQEAAARKSCSNQDFLTLQVAALDQQTNGRDNPVTLPSLTGVAQMAYERGDWSNATAVLSRELRIVNQASRRIGHSPQINSLLWFDPEFHGVDPIRVLIKAAYRLAATEKARDGELADVAFQAAQQANVFAAAIAVRQMSARLAKGTGPLAAPVRERQDLAAEAEQLDQQVASAVVQINQGRDVAADKKRRARMDAIDARLAEIDKRLAREFPDYAALASAEPATIAEIQARLGADEALILMASTPQLGNPMTVTVDTRQPAETFVWAITKTDVRWRRADLSGNEGRQDVDALRCGLDASDWTAGSEMRRHCGELLGGATSNGGLPPFDLARAYALYRALFGPVEDVIAGKQLLIVPTGSFTTLPFEVLVTQKPADTNAAKANYQGIKWLGRERAITVLPSAASLGALRGRARASAGAKPFIGFGNPLLEGDTARAAQARQRQACAAGPSARSASARNVQAGLAASEDLFRGKLANVEALRRQMPLPETVDELCAVAQQLGAQTDDVVLGGRMTESAIKQLSAKGSLQDYKVLHFATHGLVAGETELFAKGQAEPSLLFTPPASPSETDDGLLTASEIAQLRLDADWVVMSACNTAAGGAHSSEALSGLARAFFYAGARSLLVSHWAVDSDAAVAITTGAVAAMKADPAIGRSEALRRALVAVMDKGGRYAHPATWAPFVLVGDGGS